MVIDSSGTISSSRISGLGALASLDTVGNLEISGLAYSKLTDTPTIPSGALASLDTVGNLEISGLAYSKLTDTPTIPSGALASLDTVGNLEISGLAYSKLTDTPTIPSGALASLNTVGTAQIQDGSVTAAKLGSDVDLGGGAGGEVALATFGKSTTLTLSTSQGIATKVVIPWETTIVQNVAVSVSGGTITINETGTYDIKVNIGWDNDGANRSSPAISLWTDASTEITRTRTFTYSRGTNYDGIAKNTLIATTLELSAGDTLYVYGWLDDRDGNYTVHTVNNSCELVFTKLSSAVSSSSFTIPNLASVAAAGGDFGNTIRWTGGNNDIIRLYRSHNNSSRTMLKQVSDNGGLQLGTDDVLILGGGEAPGLMTSSVTTTDEKVHIGADGGICFYSWASNNANSWGNRRQITMDNAGNLVFSNGYLNAKTGVRVNGTEIISSSGTIPYSKLTGTPSLAPCATGGSISGDLVDGGTVQADRFFINSKTSTLTPEYLVGETAGAGNRYEWTKIDNFGDQVTDLLTVGNLNLPEMNIRGDFIRISKDCSTSTPCSSIHVHGTKILIGKEAFSASTIEGLEFGVNISDNTDVDGELTANEVLTNKLHCPGLQMNYTLTGGSVVSFSAPNRGTSYLKWSRRIMAITVNVPNQALLGDFNVSGYIQINMPPENTRITSYILGDISTVTVGPAGIPMTLSVWFSLYYEFVPGTNGAVTDNSKFVLIDYSPNSRAPRINSNWILIATFNADDQSLKWMPGSRFMWPGTFYNSADGSYLMTGDIATVNSALTTAYDIVETTISQGGDILLFNPISVATSATNKVISTTSTIIKNLFGIR